MAFCVYHSHAAGDIVDIIIRSLLTYETPLYPTKLARIYLVNDILYNSSGTRKNVWRFRVLFESRLVELFKHFGVVTKHLSGKLKQEQFKQVLFELLDIWTGWAIFPLGFTDHLKKAFQNAFTNPESLLDRLKQQESGKIGCYHPDFDDKSVSDSKDQIASDAASKNANVWLPIDSQSIRPEKRIWIEEDYDELDGLPLNALSTVKDVPIEAEDLGGIPMDESGNVFQTDEDLDGASLDAERLNDEEDDLDGVPFED
jgi:U2-associated protein SR140